MLVNARQFIERAAVSLGAVALAASALYFTLNVNLAESYPDFIVGNIAWGAKSKLQDLFAIPVFITVLFCSAIGLSQLFRLANVGAGRRRANDLASHLIWWSIGPLMTIASLSSTGVVDSEFYAAFIFGLLAFALIMSVASYRGIDVSPRDASLLVLAACLASLIPLEVALLIGRLPKAWFGSSGVNGIVHWLPVALAFTLSVATLWGLCAPQSLRVVGPYSALVAQLGLPAFYFALYPTRIAAPDGALFRYDTGRALLPIISLLVALSVLDVVRRFAYCQARDASLPVRVLSPLALFGLIVGLKFGSMAVPAVNPDDYHFGEYLLGNLVYAAGGLPYLDYLPAHGFVENDAPALLSRLIHDGSASGLVDAGRLLAAGIALVGFVSLYWLTGNIGLAFLCILLLAGRITWFFFIPFVCLWLSPRLMAAPARWLVVWIFTVPVVILGIPAQGLLLAVASCLIAVNMSWAVLSGRVGQSTIFPVIALAITLAAMTLTPIGPMLIKAVGYVLENGPINQAAYGRSWQSGWDPSRGYGLGFEVLRNGWVVACLVLILVSYNAWRRGLTAQAILPALLALAFCFLLIPYSMGRIDPADFSRPGAVTLFAWVILLPIATYHVLGGAFRALMITAVAFVGALLTPDPGPLGVIPQAMSLDRLRAAVLDHIKVNSALLNGHQGSSQKQEIVDAATVSLHGIGRALIDPRHFDRLRRLNSLLNAEIAPDESYLDLSSRNAQYYYVNRRPLLEVTAPYNLASIDQQKRAVRLLSMKPPRLALMEADNINHDGGGVALRSPVLYRFILQHYIPEYKSGFIVGTFRDRVDLTLPLVTIAVQDRTDPIWNHGFHRSSSSFLVGDPIAAKMIAAGDRLVFSNNERRIVTAVRADTGVVELDGPVPVKAENNQEFVWDVNPERRGAYRSALLERAFERRDLAAIPVAWGRSEGTLSKRMIKRHTILVPPAVVHDMKPEGDRLHVAGRDPFLIYDVMSQGVSGEDAGLLRLDFECYGQKEVPRLQVFWWGDGASGPTETNSLRLTASSGALIIPLDSTHRWTLSNRISGLRIDLDNASSCEAISVANIGLYARALN
ncbi:hypothetical protein ACETIH_16870 [Microvirga arabica]|uniref:Uncharacterized protein n=1 Tax=Microvirga arabica TaxID=1128671 RepID=A0ABV6YAR5_9HYPH